MAHNLNMFTAASGVAKYGYIGRQSAWHNLGTVTGTFLTWADVCAHGLDYGVTKEQLEFQGKPVEAWGTFRDDNGVFLGPVGDDYTVIDHRTGFGMVDALIGSADGAHYETAGVLGAGETVWGLADLGLSMHVGEDLHKAFLLFSTSHDGSMSYTFRTCDTRVVCNNTLNIALGEKTASKFKIRHTKNSGDEVIDAHEALNGLAADVRTVEQKLNFLANRKVTRESLDTIFDRLFPKRKQADGAPVNTTRRDNILAEILKCYESNDRDAFPEQRGTSYNLLNAITEYTDHSRSTQGGRRAESAMFGSGDRLKSQALEVILETAGGMPVVETRQTFVPARSANGAGSLLDAILEIA